jgi:hypothetical protein
VIKSDEFIHRDRGRKRTCLQHPTVITVVLQCSNTTPTSIFMDHQEIGIESLINKPRPAVPPFIDETDRAYCIRRREISIMVAELCRKRWRVRCRVQQAGFAVHADVPVEVWRIPHVGSIFFVVNSNLSSPPKPKESHAQQYNPSNRCNNRGGDVTWSYLLRLFFPEECASWCRRCRSDSLRDDGAT